MWSTPRSFECPLASLNERFCVDIWYRLYKLVTRKSCNAWQLASATVPKTISKFGYPMLKVRDSRQVDTYQLQSISLTKAAAI